MAANNGLVVNEQGQKVILNGMNVIPVWDAVGGGAPELPFQTMKAAGFNAVRFDLYWSYFEPQQGSWSPAWAALDRAVAYAKKHGLYIVPSIHQANNVAFTPGWAKIGKGSMQAMKDHGRPFVEKLAARYKDEKAIAYFTMDEPGVWPHDSDPILAWYRDWHRWVRPIAPNLMLGFQNSWGDAMLADARWPESFPETDNKVFEINDYYSYGPDFGYLMSGANPGQTSKVWQGGTSVYTDGNDRGYDVPNLGDHRGHFGRNASILKPKGIPMVVGGYGVTDVGPNAQLLRQHKKLVYDENDAGRFWWMYKVGPGFNALEREGVFKPWVRELVD